MGITSEKYRRLRHLLKPQPEYFIDKYLYSVSSLRTPLGPFKIFNVTLKPLENAPVRNCLMIYRVGTCSWLTYIIMIHK